PRGRDLNPRVNFGILHLPPRDVGGWLAPPEMAKRCVKACADGVRNLHWILQGGERDRNRRRRIGADEQDQFTAARYVLPEATQVKGATSAKVPECMPQVARRSAWGALVTRRLCPQSS